MYYRIFVLLSFIFLTSVVLVFAQDRNDNFGFSGQFFFSYDQMHLENEVRNEFLLKRGYITFRRDLHERIGIRFTQDVTIDQEGDGEGDIELRLKYALVNVKLNDLLLFKNPEFEVGVISRPWIDFEQDINDYRSQESMFLDNNNLLASADYGISLAADLGEELPESVSESLGTGGGRYGSFQIGVYNGGGYSALEKNNNKLVEGRLTLRPLPGHLPGLQASFFGSSGKGNIPESPDFNLGGSGLSFESSRWTAVVQGFSGRGDSSGRLINEHYEALPVYGWSTFHEIRPFSVPVSLLLRADTLSDRGEKRMLTRMLLGGIAYVFPNRSKIIFSYGQHDEREPIGDREFSTIRLIAEVRF